MQASRSNLLAVLMNPVAALAATAVLAAACTTPTSSSSPSAPTGGVGGRVGCVDAWPAPGTTSSTGPIPALANGQYLATGETRLILLLMDSAGFPVGDPSWTVSASLYDLGSDGCTPFASDLAMPFSWSIEKVRGFFVGASDIPASTRELGLLVVGNDADGKEVRVAFANSVLATPYELRPGAKAPTIATPIAANDPHGVAGVSTDPAPLSRLYENSTADLLAAKRPFMIVFASPAFCTSQACGPTLKIVKEAAARHPSVAIVHVEPYLMQWDGKRLLPVMKNKGLQPNAIADAWRLPVEPWIYTVGTDGVIIRSYDGVISPAELDAALAELE